MVEAAPNTRAGKKRSTKTSSPQKADFNLISLYSLKKYKKAHKVRTGQGVNKQELAEAVARHFAQLPPPADEASIIESFALAVQGQDREIKKRPKSPQK